MNFANVTGITIPEGNVVKIHETNSGHVVWQKEDFPIVGQTSVAILLTKADGTKYMSRAHIFGNRGVGFVYAYDTAADYALSRYTFPIFGDYQYTCKWESSGESSNIQIGDTFELYYAKTLDELDDFPNKAHLVDDARWMFTSTDGGYSRIEKEGLTLVTATDYRDEKEDIHLVKINTTQGPKITFYGVKNKKSDYDDYLHEIMLEIPDPASCNSVAMSQFLRVESPFLQLGVLPNGRSVKALDIGIEASFTYSPKYMTDYET